MASVRNSDHGGSNSLVFGWRENAKLIAILVAVCAAWYGLKGDVKEMGHKVDRIEQNDQEKLALLTELKVTAAELKANAGNSDRRLERIERKQDKDRADQR